MEEYFGCMGSHAVLLDSVLADSVRLSEVRGWLPCIRCRDQQTHDEQPPEAILRKSRYALLPWRASAEVCKTATTRQLPFRHSRLDRRSTAYIIQVHNFFAF